MKDVKTLKIRQNWSKIHCFENFFARPAQWGLDPGPWQTIFKSVVFQETLIHFLRSLLEPASDGGPSFGSPCTTATPWFVSGCSND